MPFKICASFHEKSNWDRNSWPDTSDTIPAQATISKSKIKKTYFVRPVLNHAVELRFKLATVKLDPKHLEGLRYDKVPTNTSKGIYLAHMYLEQAVQRRAWEVYGGPSGLQARRDQRSSFRSKWLPSGSAANDYMAACTPEREDKESKSDDCPAPSTMASHLKLKSTSHSTHSTSAEIDKTWISSSPMPTSHRRHLVKQSILQTPGTSSRLVPTSRLDDRDAVADLGVIEISDEESPSPGIATFSKPNPSWHLSSSPTIVASSPFMGSGKKRGRQNLGVIVLTSSDEDDDLAAKKQRRD